MKKQFIFRNINNIKKQIKNWKQHNHHIILIPTMGALHQGHVELIKIAKKYQKNNAKIITSIFVNPTQFAPGEDFSQYPRNEKKDINILKKHNTDAVFIPKAEYIYPENFGTKIVPEGAAQTKLEDQYRPHFFIGVVTVVTKLLLITQPKYALFGEKDYQQLITVKQTVKDLNIDTQIVGVKTKRENDGLACASRNIYLSKEQRKIAPLIYQTIKNAAQKIKNGEMPKNTLQNAQRLLEKNQCKIEYIELRNAENLKEIPLNQKYQKQNYNTKPRILIAAKIGNVRLIDNISL